MTFRKFLFWFHLAIGLSAGLVIAFMAATGILLAYEPHVVAFAARKVSTVEVPADGAAMPLSALLAGSPGDRPPTAVTVRADRAASVALAYGREKTVYVDPYTGKILGEGPKGVAAFYRTVESLHRWYALSGQGREIGKQITGAADIVFFFLLLSGLYLWWPRGGSWKAAATYKGGIEGKARYWNWHTVTGFWAIPLILLTTSTGLCLAYPWANNLIYTVTHTTPPPQNERGGRPGGGEGSVAEAEAPAADLDLLLAAAERQSSGWRAVTLNLPRPGASRATATIEESGTLIPHPRSTLVLDAASGEVVKWEPYAAQNLGRKIHAWIKPLHTGEIAGLPGAFLVTLTASSALFLVWTGFSLAWRRFFPRT